MLWILGKKQRLTWVGRNNIRLEVPHYIHSYTVIPEPVLRIILKLNLHDEKIFNTYCIKLGLQSVVTF